MCNQKNSTTGADASGKYQLAGIHKFHTCSASSYIAKQVLIIITTAGRDCMQYQHASEILRQLYRLCHSFLAQFLWTRRAICSTDRTYALPGSHVWPVLSSVKSRSPGKLTTRERSFKIKSLSIQFRENIDFYMYCWYQRLAFSERRGIPATDTHTHTHKQTTVCLRSSALALGIIAPPYSPRHNN